MIKVGTGADAPLGWVGFESYARDDSVHSEWVSAENISGVEYNDHTKRTMVRQKGGNSLSVSESANEVAMAVARAVAVKTRDEVASDAAKQALLSLEKDVLLLRQANAARPASQP